MSNYPIGAEHDDDAPYNKQETHNRCYYCDEKTEYKFCDSQCEKAYFND